MLFYILYFKTTFFLCLFVKTKDIVWLKINLDCQHPFVQKVARCSGMWNMTANSFPLVAWPECTQVDTLQLHGTYVDAWPKGRPVDLTSSSRKLDFSTLPTAPRNLFLVGQISDCN